MFNVVFIFTILIRLRKREPILAAIEYSLFCGFFLEGFPVLLGARDSLSFDCTAFRAIHMSLVLRKPVFGVSDQVPHKPGCTTTKDSLSQEISD